LDWGASVFTATLLLWAVLLALILRQRIFISHDTISNYAHVWYVADRLHATGSVPFHMPVLGHGQAFAFPYAFLPWLASALIWPALGEWSVTIMLAAGSMTLIAAMFWALPELRSNSWIATAALGSPTLVAVPIIGQLPFAWATTMLFVAVGAWRRGRHGFAALALGVAQATHPAVVAPIALALVAIWAYFEHDRRKLVGVYVIGGLLALPAAAIVLFSPVIADTTRSDQLREFAYTFAIRCPVVFVPCLLAATVAHNVRVGARVTVCILAASLMLVGFLDTSFGWRHLFTGPDNEIADIANAPEFQPGATYRVLDASDGKYSMYRVLRRGGRLDSELFPESIGRRSFATPERYTAFLQRRHVAYVIVFDRYDRTYKTNEHAQLEQLTQTCDRDQIGTRLLIHRQHHWLYQINYNC
jgi:hypothetical protein